MKWIVAVRIKKKNEVFGFKTKKAALEFIKEIKSKFANIETALAKAVV